MAQNPTAEMDRNGSTAANGSSDDSKAGAAGLAERGAALASGALDAGREYVAPIKDAGQDYAERVYKAGEQKAQEAAFYAELGYEEARDLVRANPVRALGIAAGVGFLLGVLAARRQY